MTQIDFTVANTTAKEDATRSNERKVQEEVTSHHHDLVAVLTMDWHGLATVALFLNAVWFSLWLFGFSCDLSVTRLYSNNKSAILLLFGASLHCHHHRILQTTP